jgi:hypothetical protein
VNTGKYAVLPSLILALLVAPLALAANGDPVRAGGRTTFTGIMRILGNSSTYATQQSNLNQGSGGAARYGCRSTAGHQACLLSKNVAGGAAFRFQAASALLGGTIEVTPPAGKKASDAKPFTTNATGVATGLNADQVDGKSADEIVKDAQEKVAAAIAATQPAFARVGSDGKTDQSHSQGVTDANVTHAPAANPGVYCFLGFKAAPKNASATLDTTAGQISVDTTIDGTDGALCPGASNVQLIVRTFDKSGAAADEQFFVTLFGISG